MVEGNASMYLGSPRMAEMVVGEKVSLEEMGGARMHCTVSGVGDLLAADDAEAIELAKLYFSYLPGNWRTELPTYAPEEPSAPLTRHTVPERESQPFDIHEVIDGLVDDETFFEIKPLFAPELVIGFGRMAGETVGIVANNSMVKGGVLFTDSADKAARFIWLCDAYSIPLVYLADVPGLHDRLRGRARRHHPARRQDGLGRLLGHRAAVLRRRAQGLRRRALRDGRAGLRARRDDRPADGPDRRDGSGGGGQRGLRQQDRRDRGPGRARAVRRGQRREYEEDVDLERLAADLVIDQVVEADALRAELLHRLRYAEARDRHFATKRRDIPPV